MRRLREARGAQERDGFRDVVKREMGTIWMTIASAIDKAELGKRTRDENHPDLWSSRLDMP